MAFRKNNVLKISTLILVVLLLFSLFNFYKISSNFDAYKEKSSTEFKLKQSQLDEILKKYDSIKSFTINDQSLVVNDLDKIESVVFENKKGKIKNSSEADINSQINLLKNTIDKNTKEVAFLNKKINSDKKTLDDLESLKQREIRFDADKLSAVNINTRGVKIITDKYGRNNDERIQQLRVCFTVEGNEFIRKGEKKFYIQVVNPRNQIISSESTFIELKDVKLMYSAKIDANYNQKDTDVCTYVDLEKSKTIKGKYKINVYNEFSKIGTSIFELN